MKGIALFLLVGALVIGSNLAWRLRRAHRDVATILEGEERFVDMGVVLRVVEQDSGGIEFLRGKPKLRIIREHALGGMVDTSAMPIALCGPSQRPVYWYCSAISEPLILHGDELPLNICEEGGMGAGKTTDMCQWLYVRAMELTGAGAELGATAPTNPRLHMIKQAIMDMWPSAWWRWKERDQTFTLANGIALQLVSTHQASKAEGSRIQGYNWSAAASDEIQDSLEVDADIMARGRDAPSGRFKRFATCTVKDAPEFRTWKARAKTAKHPKTEEPIWHFQRKGALDSPFFHREYYDTLTGGMTARELARMMDAIDLPPEGIVYSGWSRKDNLRPIPRLGRPEDVTARELARFGHKGDLLIGHDPGRIHDVSILLKAYSVMDQKTGTTPIDPDWYVVGEVTTEGTTDAHVTELRSYITHHYGHDCNPLIRIDPHTNGSGADDDRPDLTVLRVFQQRGFVIKPAAYKVGSIDPGRIKPEARIDLVNTLLCAANGRRRLFVACDDRQGPFAARLVDALESMVRDGNGKPEAGRKNKSDKSHWPAALAYGLYSIEKPRIENIRARGRA